MPVIRQYSATCLETFLEFKWGVGAAPGRTLTARSKLKAASRGMENLNELPFKTKEAAICRGLLSVKQK